MDNHTIDLESGKAILEPHGIYFTRKGRKYVARCPLHKDSKPSLELWMGKHNRPIVSCFPCNIHDSILEFLCRLAGHRPEGKAWRNALIECGLATRTASPMVAMAIDTHWPNGKPLPDPKAIAEALGDAGLVDLEIKSPCPSHEGEPTSYPPNVWLYVPTFYRVHPVELRLTSDEKKALVGYLAGLPDGPVLHSVVMADKHLFAMWDGADASFIHLCHRLGHDPEHAEITYPRRTIFTREIP